MNVYSLINFVHVLSSIGIFMAIAWERYCLINLTKSVSVEQKHDWVEKLMWLPRIGAPSIILVLLTGFYLTWTAWRNAEWILPSFFALVLMAVVGAIFNGTSIKTLRSYLLQNDDVVAPRAELPMGKLWIAAQLKAALVVSILYLMVAKPTFEFSIMVIATLMVISIIPVAIANIRSNKAAKST